MKHFFTKLFSRVTAVAAVALFTAASAWGETVELTQSVLGLTTSYTSGTEKTIGGITYVYTDLMNSNDRIQAKANTGVIYNKTAFPGDITSVAITHNGTARATTILGSSDGTNWTEVATGSGSITGDFSGVSYKYFKITRGSNAAYWVKIEIAYSTSSSVATTTSIISSGITNTDVYSSTVAGSLSATVKDNNNNVISDATVSWSGNNDDVATINANTGAVTLVNAGTVTFTATYAGVSGQYAGSTATYQMTVTSSVPYVQIGIIPNYTFWGKTAQFSGNDFAELHGSKDNVTLDWIKGSGSTYANTTAMRFYKDNQLTFKAPDGYVIQSIKMDGSFLQPDDLAFSPTGYDSSSHTWSGSSTSVTMSRPSSASSYVTISKYTITIGSPSTDPVINAEDLSIEYNATSGSIAYTIANPVSDGVLTASTAAEWLTLGTVAETVPFTCTANTDNSSRTATVTLTYTYNTNEVVTRDVTITQAAQVIDYATLPFSWTSNYGSTPQGITNSDVSTGSGSAYLKFDANNDNIVLKINECPGELSFTIKGNPSSGSAIEGTFKVQVSVDGNDYSDLETYTNITNTNHEESFTTIPENVRFIKWVYVNKVTGNVALSNISLTKRQPAAPDTYDLNLTAGDGGYWGTFYNSVAGYQLPEGAQAFTMNANKQLYRLGSNGRIIPAGTAVVIIADVQAITLTKGESAEDVTVNGGDNILQGDDFSVAKTGNQYVLGKKDGVIGFFNFTGASIPANKAYYVYVVSE